MKKIVVLIVVLTIPLSFDRVISLRGSLSFNSIEAFSYLSSNFTRPKAPALGMHIRMV